MDAAKKCWFVTDNDPAHALDVIVGVWVTSHRLSDIARRKLGNRGWAVLQEWNDIVCRYDCTDEAIGRTLERLKNAEVATTGETATLTIKWADDEPLEKPVFGFSGDDPVARFRRVQGHWKIDAGLTRSSDFFEQGTWGQKLKAQIKVTEQITERLEKGELRTDEETIAAFTSIGENGATSPKPRRLGPKLDQVGVPSATHLESGNLALSTNHPPVLAVSHSGVIYVFWPARGQKTAVRSSELPLIPQTYGFGDCPSPEFSSVPGVNVCRNGSWSKPGVLVEGQKDCDPCFAWCASEQLHLLVSDAVKRRTHHFTIDPRRKQWDKVAELPYQLTHYDAFRLVGNSVHIGFAESTARELGKGTVPQGPDDRFSYPEHTYASYVTFDGQHWSKPVRLEQSDNQSRHVTRVRLAVDRSGTAYAAWWSGNYGYAEIRNGKANYAPLHFTDTPIDDEEFDLGIDPHDRVIVAYKADLPKSHPDARKIHVRRREEGQWTEPEKIGGEGEALMGSIRVVDHSDRTLVTWVTREEYTERGGVLGKGLRRFSIDDGKSWSPSRWMARFPTLRGNGVPISGKELGICVDGSGRVHICEETRHYCLVASLKN